MKWEVSSHRMNEELAKRISQVEHVLDHFKLRLMLECKSREF